MIYRVMLNGERIIVNFAEGESICGFVKNEYVWAYSEEKAIAEAEKHVLSQLSANPAIRLFADSGVSFQVDEVEAGVAPWKLLTNEGFIFYKLVS